jgi:hypothetical protein
VTIESQRKEERLPLSFSSVLAGSDSIYAASVGGGIYRKAPAGVWTNISDPFLEGSTVNRLNLYGDTLYASTSTGLYSYTQEEWEEELDFPCYQYRVEGGCRYAATAYGLWCDYTGTWGRVAYSDIRVYDFINSPQFMIVAHEQGLAMYDRMTDGWADFALDTGVTSLAVFQGHLLGSSERGELIIGNKQGVFDRINFKNTFVFSVLKKDSSVFVCTDKGLYRFGYLLNQPTLFSIKLGGPITDIDCRGGQLYMATLFEGIKSAPFHPVSPRSG